MTRSDGKEGPGIAMAWIAKRDLLRKSFAWLCEEARGSKGKEKSRLTCIGWVSVDPGDMIRDSDAELTRKSMKSFGRKWKRTISVGRKRKSHDSDERGKQGKARKGIGVPGKSISMDGCAGNSEGTGWIGNVRSDGEQDSLALAGPGKEK